LHWLVGFQNDILSKLGIKNPENLGQVDFSEQEKFLPDIRAPCGNFFPEKISNGLEE